MKRTTIYLPEDMKTGIEREAVRLGVTEAEVIRIAVGSHFERETPPEPELPLFAEGFGIEIATRVDELLDGMDAGI